MALAGAAMLVLGTVSSVVDAGTRFPGILFAVIGGLVATSAYMVSQPSMPGDQRTRRRWWIIGLTFWLSTCGGGPLVAIRQNEIDRLSTSAADAAQRGRLVRRLTLVDSMVTSREGSLRLLEAWVEREMAVRHAVLAAATGRELVAVRVHPRGALLRLRVVTADSVETPTLLFVGSLKPPYVAVGIRQHPIGDFLQLEAGASDR